MLIHAKHWWPEVIQPCLWPFALKQAEFNLNNLRLGKSGKSRAENFSAMHNKINIRHYHTFGCLMYVLDTRFQGASFIPKWDERVRVGAYVGRSPIHAGNVSLILNLSTGHVSPKFHVVFEKIFSTVPSLKTDHFQLPESSFLSFFLLVRPPRPQRLPIMVWCYSKTGHRRKRPLDSGPIF